MWTLPRPEASEESTLEATMSWSWWPSSYIWRGRKKQCNTRIRFDLEKLKDPEVAEIFKAKIGGKFAALSILDSDMNMDMLTDTFNTVVTDTANEILGKDRPVKKPWVTTDILDLYAKRRKLKNKGNNKDRDGMAQYRAVNQEIKKGMKKAKENWIGDQCQNIDDWLKKNNSKKAYKLVQDLTGTKQGRTTTIQDKGGTRLTENEDILKRWTEYCSELYNYRATGDPEVLNVPLATNNANHPILCEEVEAAVKSLRKGKSAGVDNIPAKLLQQGGEAMVNALLIICNKIWQTGKWPTPWTQSLVITLPKKGNLQLCQNYRTSSLISHRSKSHAEDHSKIVWKPEAEKIIAEEQAGFRPGCSHYRADLQPQDTLWEVPPTPTGPLSCLHWDLDINSRSREKDTDSGNEKFQTSPWHLVQRPHHQRRGMKQDLESHLTLRRTLVHCKTTQNEVVWACHKRFGTYQDSPPGPCTRREKERQTEKTMGT